jgi:hypothetical protein
VSFRKHVGWRYIQLWLKVQRNTKQAYQWLFRNSSFACVVGVYVELPSELSLPNSFIKQSMLCDLRTKSILLGALSAGTTTYLSWRWDKCFGHLDLYRLMFCECSFTLWVFITIHRWSISFNLSFSFEWEIVVWRLGSQIL